VKEARKKMYNCAFLALVLVILDVDVGAGSRPNVTACTVAYEIPEVLVASVAMNTLNIFQTFSPLASASLVEECPRGERLAS